MITASLEMGNIVVEMVVVLAELMITASLEMGNIVEITVETVVELMIIDVTCVIDGLMD